MITRSGSGRESLVKFLYTRSFLGSFSAVITRSGSRWHPLRKIVYIAILNLSSTLSSSFNELLGRRYGVAGGEKGEGEV